MTAALQSSLLWTLTPSRVGRVAVPSNGQDCISMGTELDFPLIVQPAHEGISGGTAKMTSVDESIAARTAANTCDWQVMVDAAALDSPQRLSAMLANSPQVRG